jgi:hypothetical protein
VSLLLGWPSKHKNRPTLLALHLSNSKWQAMQELQTNSPLFLPILAMNIKQKETC